LKKSNQRKILSNCSFSDVVYNAGKYNFEVL
jgi:hypothetical protein